MNKEIALNVIYALWNLIVLTTVLLALPEIFICNKHSSWAGTYTVWNINFRNVGARCYSPEMNV
jgi:hypothetical protein